MLHSNKETIRQNILTFPELGYNYWAINKNATSSLTKYFALQIGIKINEEQHQDAKIKLKHQNRYISQDQALNNGLKNLTVVRNPFTRFESCYRMFKFPEDDIQRFAASKARFDKNFSIQDFLLSIQKTWNFRKKQGNKHYWKQTWFVPDKSKIDHIVKLENLAKYWPSDLPIPTEHLNTTDKKSNIQYKYDKVLLSKMYKDDFVSFKYKVLEGITL